MVVCEFKNMIHSNSGGILPAPLIMAICSDDSAQIRYSDSSLLHFTPCGTSFVYHGTDSGSTHPYHRSQGRYQRTRFVTSTHRDLVIRALDFRNRFSDRPYLCEELLPSQDIQSRYSDVMTSVWPLSLADANISSSPDGSVTITSCNRHVTLILSYHGREFTVCYLSKLSQCRKTGQKRNTATNECKSVNISTNISTLDGQINNYVTKSHNETENSQSEKMFLKSNNVSISTNSDALTNTPIVPENSVRNSDNNYFIKKNDIIYMSTSTENANEESVKDLRVVVGENGCKVDSNNLFVSSNSAFCQYEDIRGNSDNIGDISLVESCCSTARQFDESYLQLDIVTDHRAAAESASKGLHKDNIKSETFGQIQRGVSNESGDRDQQRPPHQQRQPHQQRPPLSRAVSHTKRFPQKCDAFAVGDLNFDISSLNLSVNSESGDNALVKAETSDLNTQPRSVFITGENRGTNDVSASNETQTGKVNQKSDIDDSVQIGGQKQPPLNSSNAGRERDGRFLYTWVTQHCSVMECLQQWQHALSLTQLAQKNMASGGKIADSQQVNTSSSSTKTAHPAPAVGEDMTVRCPLPVPLPVTCPGQHLHKQLSTRTGDVEQSGQLKVLVSEGVIYRFSGSGNCRSVDIYPGDGSVVYSDSLTQKYYTHVEGLRSKNWRSYSLKCPPPDHPKQPYSIAKLITTAARYLSHMSGASASILGNVEAICWQYTPRPPRATPTELIEECSIPRVARYRAYNSGLVSVLFADRSSLEMMAELSPRLARDDVNRPAVVQPRPDGQCKILLPSGEFIAVSTSNAGKYQWYVSMAREWVDWVNAAPSSRTTDAFCNDWKNIDHYKAVEKELQKINCFNYILDNTGHHVSLQPRDTLDSDTRLPRYQNISGSVINGGQVFSCHEDVRSALNMTSRVIGDIDSLLSVTSFSK